MSIVSQNTNKVPQYKTSLGELSLEWIEGKDLIEEKGLSLGEECLEKP